MAANAEVFSCKGASSGKRVCSSQKRSVKCGLPKHVYAQPFFAIRVRTVTTDAVCRLRGSWRGKRRDVSGGRLLVIFGWRCPVWDAGCRCFLLVCNVSLERLSSLYVKKILFPRLRSTYLAFFLHVRRKLVPRASFMFPSQAACPNPACNVVPVLGVPNGIQQTCSNGIVKRACFGGSASIEIV